VSVVDVEVANPVLAFGKVLDVAAGVVAPAVDAADNRLNRSFTTLLTSLCKAVAELVAEPLVEASLAEQSLSPSGPWPVPGCEFAYNWVRSDWMSALSWEILGRPPLDELTADVVAGPVEVDDAGRLIEKPVAPPALEAVLLLGSNDCGVVEELIVKLILPLPRG
jgi:hypothetical protein